MKNLLRRSELIWAGLFGLLAAFSYHSAIEGLLFALFIITFLSSEQLFVNWKNQKTGRNLVALLASLALFSWVFYAAVNGKGATSVSGHQQTTHEQEQTSAASTSKVYDSIIRIDLALPLGCCGSSRAAAVAQNCLIQVDIQYCRTQIINNVPISFCYATHEARWGTFNPYNNCCAVVMPELGGRIICVRPGSTVTLGPVMLSAVPSEKAAETIRQ